MACGHRSCTFEKLRGTLSRCTDPVGAMASLSTKRKCSSKPAGADHSRPSDASYRGRARDRTPRARRPNRRGDDPAPYARPTRTHALGRARTPESRCSRRSATRPTLPSRCRRVHAAEASRISSPARNGGNAAHRQSPHSPRSGTRAVQRRWRCAPRSVHPAKTGSHECRGLPCQRANARIPAACQGHDRDLDRRVAAHENRAYEEARREGEAL